MKARWTDRVALVLAIISLLLWVGMNVSPIFNFTLFGEVDVLWGWSVWPSILSSVTDFDNMSVVSSAPPFAWLLGPLIVLSTPFIIKQLSMYRLLWWSMTILSALVMFGLTGVVGYQFLFGPEGPLSLGIGAYQLFYFPVVHFVSLLWIRRREGSSEGQLESDYFE